jgi:hypothetical protein
MNMNINVPKGHVALVLLRDENNSAFYLQIPLNIINDLCLRPLKYLHFLAWCILGAEGVLALEFNGDEIDTDGYILDQEIYYYVPNDILGTFFHDAITIRTLMACYRFNEDLARVIDLEVIKTGTSMSSETSQTHDDFRARLLERDVCCVWSGITYGVGLHIIPFKRGSDVRSIIFCSECLIVSLPSAHISVASPDHSESTKIQRVCGGTE